MKHGRVHKGPMRHPKCQCGAKGVRDERFDAYYCPRSGDWLEAACRNPECAYCKGRGPRAWPNIPLDGWHGLFDIERPSVTLIVGAPGVGKTTLATQIACSASPAGPRSLYEEPRSIYLSTYERFPALVERRRRLGLHSHVQWAPLGPPRAHLATLMEHCVRDGFGRVTILDSVSGIDRARLASFASYMKEIAVEKGLAIVMVEDARKQGLRGGGYSEEPRADLACIADAIVTIRMSPAFDGTRVVTIRRRGRVSKLRLSLTEQGFLPLNKPARRPSNKR